MTALYIKHRPKSFDEIFGNEHIVDSLKSILKRDDKPHTYLFSGNSGCGKTTFARIVSNQLDCSEHDFVEINVSNNRGIDTAREIISTMHLKPIKGNVKVYLLDEVHQSTKDFMNALLKALEDTPNHVYFILCTTDPNKLLKTIKTRCTTFDVEDLSYSGLFKFLSHICNIEDIKMPTDHIKQQIAKKANGSPRQALVILDQIRDLDFNNDEDKILKSIKDVSSEDKFIIDLCRRLMRDNVKWIHIANILKGIKDDPEKIRWAVLGYCNSILLKEDNPKAAMIIEYFKEPFYNSKMSGLISACYGIVSE